MVIYYYFCVTAINYSMVDDVGLETLNIHIHIHILVNDILL